MILAVVSEAYSIKMLVNANGKIEVCLPTKLPIF